MKERYSRPFGEMRDYWRKYCYETKTFKNGEVLENKMMPAEVLGREYASTLSDFELDFLERECIKWKMDYWKRALEWKENGKPKELRELEVVSHGNENES